MADETEREALARCSAGRPGILLLWEQVAIVPYREPPESATEAGLRAGYMADAEVLIRRVGARGVAIVPLEGEGFDAAIAAALRAAFTPGDDA